MTLPEAVRTVVGDGSVFDDPATPNRINPVDILTEADMHAPDVLARFGVFYSDDDSGEGSTDATIAQLARSYAGSYDPDAILAALSGAGVVSWDASGPEHVSDLVRWYAEPHKHAAYYLGLAIGWRAAQQYGGVR